MNLKRVVVLALMAIVLAPGAVLADSVDFSFLAGTLSGSTSGLSSTGAPSTLTTVARLPGGASFIGSLGTFSLTTGALTSGSLAAGGTFSNTGSSITVVTNGSWGSIAAGTIFSGAFSGPVTWTQTTTVGTSVFYNLTGNVSGNLSTALAALLFPGCTNCTDTTNGSLFTLSISTPGAFVSSANIQSGNLSIVVPGPGPNAPIPEPGTLALFGTGLAAIASYVRRRMKA